MATRSLIAKKIGEDEYKWIYCHWDGYPSWNGVILRTFYQDDEKVNELLNLGDISSLGPLTRRFREERDPAWAKDLFTVAYHRDRGEEKRISTGSWKELLEDAQGVDYIYLWDFGKAYWQVFTKTGKPARWCSAEKELATLRYFGRNLCRYLEMKINGEV